MRGFMRKARAKMMRSTSYSSDIGDFPWGKSASPPNTPTKSEFGDVVAMRRYKEGEGEGEGVYEALLVGLEALPLPKMKVEGWGKPEVLMDGLLFGSDSEEEDMGGDRTPKLVRRAKERSPSPELRIVGREGGLLRDEKEPEWEEVEVEVEVVVPPKRVSSLVPKSLMRAPSVRSRFANMSVV
jgi:hypothetical protein